MNIKYGLVNSRTNLYSEENVNTIFKVCFSFIFALDLNNSRHYTSSNSQKFTRILVQPVSDTMNKKYDKKQNLFPSDKKNSTVTARINVAIFKLELGAVRFTAIKLTQKLPSTKMYFKKWSKCFVNSKNKSQLCYMNTAISSCYPQHK